MQKNKLFYNIIFSTLFLVNICLGKNTEPWISANDLFNINLNMSSKEVINKIGKPIFFESESDDDEITTSFYYNFKTTNNTKNGNGRFTMLEFIFLNDILISWEENKVALAMTKTHLGESRGPSFLLLFGILVDIILLVHIF